MRSRLPRNLRRFLDRLLVSPSGKSWLRGCLALSVVGVAAMIWDLQRQVVPGIRSKEQEMTSLRTLEQDLRSLREKAGAGKAPLEREAWQGVFADWTALAAWLEIVREQADSMESDLEWHVEEGGLQDPRFPDLQVVRVEWTLSPSDPSFARVMEFVHRQVQDGKRLISLEELAVEADDLGVRSVKFRVKTWMRAHRG